MIRIVPTVLMVLASCSSVEWRGASTRLTLLDPAPALGKPLRVRLELRNQGTAPLTHVDYGAHEGGAVHVVGPDGQTVRWIGWVSQVLPRDEELAPGGTILLLEKRDLSTEYLFERPGRYRIRFTGGLVFRERMEESRDDPFVYLPSNEVEVVVGEGRPAPVVQVVRRLLPILPKGWGISTGGGEGSMTIRLRRDPGATGNEIWLVIGGTEESGYVRLAECPRGTIWVKRSDTIEPELRPKLLEVLSTLE